MFHLDTQVCVDERVATACPWCYKQTEQCHCLIFFQTCTILIGRVTLILVYLCLALHLSREWGAGCLASNQRVYCFIVAWRAFRSTPRWMTLSILIEPHWATGESFKQNLPLVEAASPLMRDRCRRALSCRVQSEAAFPLSDKQMDAVMWDLWEDWREANGGASPLGSMRCLASPTIAWPITHLAFDWTAAVERVLVIKTEKSHLSLPWQLFLLLSSTGKQSWQINRTQAGSLFLGCSNCCLKHKPNKLSYNLCSKLYQRNINCCPRTSVYIPHL